MEDAIYDSCAMREFMGINFFEQDVPDATTLLHFRHVLEEQEIGKLLFDAINRFLERTGRTMQGGSIVAAMLISASNSTTNREKKRDPEMHQTKKGNQWHFGIKCHTGVDAGSGFVHTVEATPANVHDVTVAAKLLREDDQIVYGNSAYLGLEKREEIKQNPHLSAIEYRTNRRPGRLPKVSDNAIDWERHIENRKSAVRCKVEHPYRIVKNIFCFRKTIYRGLRKNLNRLRALFQCKSVYACQGGRFMEGYFNVSNSALYVYSNAFLGLLTKSCSEKSSRFLRHNCNGITK